MQNPALIFDFARNCAPKHATQFRIVRGNKPAALDAWLQLQAKLQHTGLPETLPVRFANGASIHIEYVKRGRRIELTMPMPAKVEEVA